MFIIFLFLFFLTCYPQSTITHPLDFRFEIPIPHTPSDRSIPIIVQLALLVFSKLLPNKPYLFITSFLTTSLFQPQNFSSLPRETIPGNSPVEAVICDLVIYPPLRRRTCNIGQIIRINNNKNKNKEMITSFSRAEQSRGRDVFYLFLFIYLSTKLI